QALEVADGLDRGAVELEEHVARAEAGARRRASRHDVDDLDSGGPPQTLAERRRQRTSSARDAQVRAAEAAVAHERGDDADRGGVDGNGEAEPDARDRGVDPDDACGAV